jgi:dTDP-4-dehydrorhamnose reductase
MAHAGQHSAKALGQGHQGSEFRRDREIFMKVLVLGGGQIAKAVGAAAPAQHELAIRTHAQLNIADEKALAQTLAQVKADWIVNAAAYTAVDLAEDEAAQATAVNWSDEITGSR